MRFSAVHAQVTLMSHLGCLADSWSFCVYCLSHLVFVGGSSQSMLSWFRDTGREEIGTEPGCENRVTH